ncbi:hypothetical protein OZ411_06635 [Bradyrhizobium sp. Arg237L]|uniref:hypothetical protein n=1 Tax=Bradyrhizobium sp. Arg237L TaxID=3003352 RepID=UPI00249E3341|nr:hypothetical protein [Bradyrhizobium sp. Arg237L]MDI4232489.1 hypothetical protein [Bradyrhizobium sp. Arg237L]
MNAVEFVDAVLRSRNTADCQALLGRLLFPLLGIPEAARTEAFTTPISLPVHGGGAEELVINVAYCIADWHLLAMVTRALKNRELALNFSGLIEENNQNYNALLAMADQRPVTAVYASAQLELMVRIGGFERAAVIHDGSLPKLSEDAAAQDDATSTVQSRRQRRRQTAVAARAEQGKARKALVRLRQLAASVVATTPAQAPLPAIVIRLIGRIGDVTRGTMQAVLSRDAPPRRDQNGFAMSGPRELGPFADHLRAGFGVHVLQTNHGLRQLGFTKNGADTKIEEKLAGGELGVAALMAIGRDHLAAWTGFDSEDELANYCRYKHAALTSRGFALPLPDRPSRIEAEVGRIDRLSTAYSRAKAISRVFERTHNESQRLARLNIDVAFRGVGSAFSARDLIEIAMVADINPIALWPNHTEVSAEAFEVFRFIGRLQRGADAVLARDHFDIVKQAIARAPGERTFAEKVICGTLLDSYNREQLAAALDLASSSAALVIRRRTREFALNTE